MDGGGQGCWCSSLGNNTPDPFSARQRSYHFRHGAHLRHGRNLRKDTTSYTERGTSPRKPMTRAIDLEVVPGSVWMCPPYKTGN